MRRAGVTALAVPLAVGGGWAAVGLVQAARQAATTAEQPADLLTAATAGLLALLLLRGAGWALSLAWAVLSPRSRRAQRCALRLSPRVVRPLVVVLLGAGLGLTGVGSAAAAGQPAAPSAPSAEAPASLPDPAWVSGPRRSRAEAPVAPSLPAAGWVAAPPAAPTAPPGDVSLVAAEPSRQPVHDDLVVVRRGDTLWSLARRQLGRHASDAEVAAAWPRWWAANRTVIGEDPNLLLPGTRLTAPIAATTGTAR